LSFKIRFLTGLFSTAFSGANQRPDDGESKRMAPSASLTVEQWVQSRSTDSLTDLILLPIVSVRISHFKLMRVVGRGAFGKVDWQVDFCVEGY
jgi:hypothetical protein